jgi:hypothetical protein
LLDFGLRRRTEEDGIEGDARRDDDDATTPKERRKGRRKDDERNKPRFDDTAPS